MLAQVTYTTTDAGTAGAAIIINLISGVIGLGFFIFGIFCIIDVTKHDEAPFQAAGTPKNTALILTIVGLLCCGFVNLYYWFGIRPKVLQAEQGMGGAPGGYQQPPPAV